MPGMVSFMVVATMKETILDGGAHRHIACLALEDGRRVPKSTAMRFMRLQMEGYYTWANGERAQVEIAGPCSACQVEYLRTRRDRTNRNRLLALPDG